MRRNYFTLESSCCKWPIKMKESCSDLTQSKVLIPAHGAERSCGQVEIWQFLILPVHYGKQGGHYEIVAAWLKTPGIMFHSVDIHHIKTRESSQLFQLSQEEKINLTMSHGQPVYYVSSFCKINYFFRIQGDLSWIVNSMWRMYVCNCFTRVCHRRFPLQISCSH